MMRSIFKRIVARLSLRWRLALASFGLLTVLLTAMGVAISYTAEQALLASQASSFITEVRLAVEASNVFQVEKTNLSPTTIVLDINPQKLPQDKLQQELKGLIGNVIKLTGQVATASVLNPQGDQLASTDSFPGKQPPATLSQSAINQLIASQSTYALADDSNGQRQMLMLLPISVENHTAALLELNTPTSETDKALLSLREILLIAIFSVLLLAAVLTVPLINIGLRPLVEMEQTSRKIAEGTLSLRLTEPGPRDEIGRLARSFNNMVARLEAMFARQKRFVADVSHELRTPLTALGGSLEMLLLEANSGDPAATRRLLRGMYAETERMQRMVIDLLALTRLDEGQIQVRKAQVDVAALVQSIGEQGQAIAQGQELSWHVEAGTPSIYADGDHLRRVLLNLVENAVKFTPPEKCVEIRAGQKDQKGVWIEVRDTGCGISDRELPHVFDRFYRADPARVRATGQPGGSGLGLAIARGLVEAQGGTIAIESKPGVGTRVRLTLPG